MTREEAIKVIRRTKGAMVYTEKEKEALETLIPELAESEDERMLREIKRYIKEQGNKPTGLPNGTVAVADMIAWLEKQKEYISNNFDDVWDEEDCEEIIAEGQKLTPRFKELLKEVCHAWYDRGAQLEKQKEQFEEPKIAFGDWGDKEKKEAIITCLKYMRFIKKITNQEYDDLTKWLDNNLVSNILEKGECLREPTTNLVEWSKEDDNYFHSIYHYLRFLKEGSENEFVKNDIEKNINWFCRLYQTPPKQDKQEWSEEDENIFNDILVDMADRREMFKSNGEIEFAEDTQKKIDWLSSHLPKFQSSYPQQKSAEWSEEDEEILKLLILNIGRYMYFGGMSSERILSFLKSLRPQYHVDVTMTEAYKMGKEAGEASHWKPSEHQMNILKAVKDYVGKGSGYWGEGLGSLIDDLEKLI